MNEKFYKQIFDSITDGIYYLNKSGTITYWNTGAERISGYGASEVLGKGCKDNLLRHVDENGVDLCTNGCPLEATMTDGIIREATVFMHHKMGHRLLINVKSFPLTDASGKINGAAEVFTEIRKSNDLAHELELLRKEVMTDPLTGMANRRCLDVTAIHFEESIRNNKLKFGVLFIDIDHFKKVNDRHGHKLGDQVLSMVAKTVSSALRPPEIASRWGGEEFVVLAPGIDEKGLAVLAERLRKLIELSWIDTILGKLSVTASFGGTMVRPDETICSAIHRADSQLYLSKQAGRNCIHIDGEKYGS